MIIIVITEQRTERREEDLLSGRFIKKIFSLSLFLLTSLPPLSAGEAISEKKDLLWWSCVQKREKKLNEKTMKKGKINKFFFLALPKNMLHSPGL